MDKKEMTTLVHDMKVTFMDELTSRVIELIKDEKTPTANLMLVLNAYNHYNFSSPIFCIENSVDTKELADKYPMGTLAEAMFKCKEAEALFCNIEYKDDIHKEVITPLPIEQVKQLVYAKINGICMAIVVNREIEVFGILYDKFVPDILLFEK